MIEELAKQVRLRSQEVLLAGLLGCRTDRDRQSFILALRKLRRAQRRAGEPVTMVMPGRKSG